EVVGPGRLDENDRGRGSCAALPPLWLSPLFLRRFRRLVALCFYLSVRRGRGERDGERDQCNDPTFIIEHDLLLCSNLIETSAPQMRPVSLAPCNRMRRRGHPSAGCDPPAFADRPRA